MSFIMKFCYSAEVSASDTNIQSLGDVYGEKSCFWKEEDGRLTGIVPCSDQKEFISLHDEKLRDTVLSIVKDSTSNKAVINQFPTPEFMALYKDFSPLFNLTCVTS